MIYYPINLGAPDAELMGCWIWRGEMMFKSA
jgi:hypothetical protein